jgi:hypothetical protein
MGLSQLFKRIKFYKDLTISAGPETPKTAWQGEGHRKGTWNLSLYRSGEIMIDLKN